MAPAPATDGATSRVGDVRIRLRVPADLADRVDAVRGAVERDVVVRVLEELERRVHARFGATAILRIRSLSVAWRIDVASLADNALVSRLADDLSAELVVEATAIAKPSRLRPRGANVVLFADVAHARAAAIADAADGRGDDWIHGGVGASDAWHAAIADGGEAVAAVIAWLERMDAVDAVLAATPPAMRAALVGALPIASWPEAARRVIERVERRDRRVPARPVRAGAADMSTPPTMLATTGPDAVVPALAPVFERVPGTVAPRTSAGTDLGDVTPVAVAPLVADPDAVERVTRYAGVFYLAHAALEIGLAERLWAAGLPEGDVLAHVAAAIVGDPDDVAWRWFGGAFDREPTTPAVAAWARDEIRDQTMHGLGLRLVHCGVDTTPAVLDATLDRLARVFPPIAPLAPELDAVVRRSAAALACLIAARLGRAFEPDVIRAVCERPGRLVLEPDRLVVEIPADHLDLDLRRAGLDRDPGHVAWIGRRVTIQFTGLDEL